jgi:uncharacterized protein YcfJ
MKSMEEIAEQQQITEELSYDTIIQKLQEAKENNIPLDEGILGALTGGLLGATMGPSVMRAICKILGVDERGQFGSLLTSRMMTTALGAAMGWK